MDDVHAASRAATRPEDGDAEEVLALETPRLFSIAVAILRDSAEAEDAVQETLMAAWKRWDTLRNPGSRRHWLTRICVRQAIGARGRMARLPFLGLDRNPVEAAAVARDLDMERLYRTLSTRQRAVLTLHYHHGYTLDECAFALGCRPGTVRSHLARALSAMRAGLARDD